MRLKKICDMPTFLGYKFQFRGRFSRKQRSASLCFRKGLIPLNTINIRMDYGCVTVPLLNSAVSIKVWLFKNTNVVEVFDLF